jgi:hypothetical protein
VPAPRAERRTRRESGGGSSRRTVGILLACLLAVAALVVLAVSALGGGSSGKTGSTATLRSGSASTTTGAKHTAAHAPKPAGHVLSAADTPISVLNGTEAAGLAHHVSASLQQRGYSQAAALAGRPPGANQVTVVQYASGHRPEAEAVAHTLGVQTVQPLESAVSALAGTAKVVVVVGADEATTGP